MSEVFGFFLSFVLMSIFAFFVLKSSIKSLGDFELKQIVLLSMVMPMSLYFPMFFFKLLELKAFLLYLITIPVGVFLTKKIVNVKELSFKEIRKLYFQLLWKVILGFLVLGVIVRVISLFLKQSN